MSGYRLLYHPRVLSRDIPRLDPSVRTRVRGAIERKLGERPEAFAKPLAHTTERLWSLRVGDWRVIFTLRENEIWILRIGHRRDVYGDLRYPESTGHDSVSEAEDNAPNGPSSKNGSEASGSDPDTKSDLLNLDGEIPTSKEDVEKLEELSNTPV